MKERDKMNEYFLSPGKHGSREEGLCAMEWVAYLAGEPHSDGPVCVSPLLQAFCVKLNDALPDGQRQRLRPYLARTIGTSGDGLDVQRRWLCADWLIREYAPARLDLVPGLGSDAAALRALPPVASRDDVDRAMPSLTRARANADAARGTARVAAWVAARVAAWVAAGVAARVAAWDAAWDAAGVAAGDAAGAAAGDTAGAAAGDALTPTVSVLQDSVLRPGGLLDRMLPTELVQLPVVEDWREVCAIA